MKLLREADSTDEQRNGITQFILDLVQDKINAMPSDYVPGIDENSPKAKFYAIDLARINQLAKSIGRTDLLEPFLEKFLVRFEGLPDLPAESEEDFLMRKEAMFRLLHLGVFVMDRIALLGRDKELLNGFVRFYETVMPDFVHDHHLIDFFYGRS